MADCLIGKLTFFQIFQSGLATLTAKLIKEVRCRKLINL